MLENRNNNALTRDRVLSSLCLIVFVLLFIFSCMRNSITFGDKIVGTFGIAVYPVLIILSLVCLAKFLGLNYQRSIKATVYMILFLFSLLAVIHSIRTFSILDSVSSKSTFSEYLQYAYSNLTVLGAVGCLLCGAISYLIGAMGSIVVNVILATIFIGLFIDFQIYGKFEQKHIRKLHSRRLQEKVIKSDDNTSADGTPNYSFSDQKLKYTDDDVAAEITANFNSNDENFEDKPKSYTENDIVDQVDDNQIYDNNQSYYSDNQYNFNTNISPNYNDNYYPKYEENYYNNSQSNNLRSNPFGSDAVELNQYNKFSNSGYNTPDYPNVYDENEERRKFLQATFNTEYNPNSYTESSSSSGSSTDYGSYSSYPNSSNGSYDSSYSSNNYNSINSFNSSYDDYNSNDYSSNSSNSVDNDGRLTRKDMEWKFNDDDFNYEYQFNGEEEKPNDSTNSIKQTSDENNNFTPNSVYDKISEILGDKDDLEDLTKKDFNTNYQFSSSSNNFSQETSLDSYATETNANISSSFESNFDSNPIQADYSSSSNNVMIPAKQPEKKANSSSKLGLSGLKYNPPPLSLLNPIIVDNENHDEEQERKSNSLKLTLEAFNLPIKVENIVRGPKITRYELSVPLGVSIKKIPSYELDIKSALAAKTINIQAPIPGSKFVGIELENDTFTNVSQRELFESDAFKNSTEPLTVAIGKDISGKIIVGSLAKMVHLLVAGQTGSGKSVFIHNLIISLIYKYSPDDLRFVLIDPKQVEFNKYNGLPHLLTPEVVVGTEKAVSALKWCVSEMDRRYALMKMSGYNNIVPYNSSELVKAGQFEKLTYIVVIVDEFPEVIMSNKKDAEYCIQRLTQLARACGIHLILVAQRPSVDVMSGVIKNNVPTRIAFSLSSSFDSKTILDTVGAENLLGGGDMLYKANGTSFIARLQGSYCTDEEIQRVIDYDKKHNAANYDDTVNAMINSQEETSEGGGASDGEIPPPKDLDPYFKISVKIFMQNGSASASYLQRRLQIGYARAARIMDQLENRGYISGASGSKTRKVTITPEQYKRDFGEDIDLGSDDGTGEV